ncbi:hypothetical protein, partial [Robertkochia aurantiaca]|uniref:hypothetical protein n=1 Tax=Robertkochia aurantiaca TaxID=2873700 RepID=UPI001CC93004
SFLKRVQKYTLFSIPQVFFETFFQTFFPRNPVICLRTFAPRFSPYCPWQLWWKAAAKLQPFLIPASTF